MDRLAVLAPYLLVIIGLLLVLFALFGVFWSLKRFRTWPKRGDGGYVFWAGALVGLGLLCEGMKHLEIDTAGHMNLTGRVLENCGALMAPAFVLLMQGTGARPKFRVIATYAVFLFLTVRLGLVVSQINNPLYLNTLYGLSVAVLFLFAIGPLRMFRGFLFRLGVQCEDEVVEDAQTPSS